MMYSNLDFEWLRIAGSDKAMPQRIFLLARTQFMWKKN